MCFDVKADGRRKARIVAGGNWTVYDSDADYSGVVTLDSIRLLVFVNQLNRMRLCATDIGNAYLHSLTQEKVYTIAGKECGALAGRVMILHKALYGLKSSAARWHEYLTASLRHMGFRPSKSDTDLYMRDCGNH